MPLNEAIFAAAVRAINDKDAFVRSRAILVCAKSPVRCEKLLPQLIHLLDKSDEYNLELLFKAVGAEKSVPVLVDYFQTHSGGERKRSLYFLGRLYLGQNDVATELVQKAVGDEDPFLRKWAIVSVTGSPHAKVLLKELANAVNDPDKEVAYQALACLSCLGASADPAVPTLLKAMEQPTLRCRIITTLGFVGIDDQKVLERLIECLGDKEDADVMASAALALGKRRSRAKTAIPHLIKLLDNKHRFSIGTTVRGNAATALGEIGQDAKGAVPVLVKILTDSADQYPIGFEEMKKALETIDPAARRDVDLMREQRNPTPAGATGGPHLVKP